MSTIDGVMLRAIRAELLLWRDARVQQIRDPREHCLVLELYRPDRGPGFLLLDAGSPPRIHMLEHPPAHPPQPSALCRLFRSRLVGSRLIDVEMRGLERVMMLSFTARGDGDAIDTWNIACEMFGRRGNIVLTTESGRILDAIHRVVPRRGATSSAGRSIRPGLPYVWPPQPGGLGDALLSNEAELRQRLELQCQDAPDDEKRSSMAVSVAHAISRTAPGLGPALAAELVTMVGATVDASHVTPVAIAAVAREMDGLLHRVRDDKFAPCRILSDSDGAMLRYAALPLAPHEGETVEPFATVSGLLEAVFAEAAPRSRNEERLQ